ncbi:hypothetical protein WJX79_009659 [Trebouxia sp. C0005]
MDWSGITSSSLSNRDDGGVTVQASKMHIQRQRLITKHSKLHPGLLCLCTQVLKNASSVTGGARPVQSGMLRLAAALSACATHRTGIQWQALEAMSRSKEGVPYVM